MIACQVHQQGMCAEPSMQESLSKVARQYCVPEGVGDVRAKTAVRVTDTPA